MPAQGRPNWEYYALVFEGDRCCFFQIDNGRTKLNFHIGQPNSPAFLEALHDVFQVGSAGAWHGGVGLLYVDWEFCVCVPGGGMYWLMVLGCE